jgi:putative ABC transport system permease protein
MQDVRLAIRRLVSRPGYTLVTILTLALGIGASTAVFSVVDQTILRPAPFAHADRLVDVININRATGSGGNSRRRADAGLAGPAVRLRTPRGLRPPPV